MKKDSIGNRMKENYEFRSRFKLIRRIPVIIRLDGKSFTRITRNYAKPFDERFSDTMNNIAKRLLDEIQGAKCAYCQSDEISILLTDFDSFTTDAWFDYNKSKLESVSAGMASAYFSHYCEQFGIFDSRAFNIPKEEVCNYFVWRQQDWIRNSINMLAGAMYSHKELDGKNSSERQDMLNSRGINWAYLDSRWKNGTLITREDMLYDAVFTRDRNVIEKYLVQGE